MIINFFIKRPIFTSVCSFIIIVAGLICIPILPIAQYPELAPPMITVTANYTGANAQVVETAVTTPLEQAINGIEGMKYITSQSGNDGTSTIQVTFDLGMDQDMAAVDVQNRISSVLGTLPEDVQKTGTSITKQTTAIVSAYAFYAENDEYDNVFISNYVDKFVREELERVDGVGSVNMAGERKYSMRVWLDSDKLTARGLTASDVVSAIQEQNKQAPAGQIGQSPTYDDQKYQISVKVIGRLTTPEEFKNIILKADKSGTVVRIKDVARVELGSEDYSVNLRYNRKPSVGVMIYQLSDANALKVYQGIHEKMDELSKSFPPGLKASEAFETTSVVKESIEEVVFTLLLSIFLVVTVIFFFLQSWRSTLIPVITIPVSLIGTFAILKVFDFSINTLTLFGIVLATGLVVDDAIVVIENIERYITEKHLKPIEAAFKGMKDVTGAVIASTIVLAAVFLPVACFGGTTGQLYKQFALTIVFSVGISLFNALTLTPALSALLLKHREGSVHSFFDKVESFITYCRDKYHALLEKLIKFKVAVIVLFIIMMGATYYLLQIVPGGFVPNEDKSYFITTIQSPEGTSLAYTTEVLKKIEEKMFAVPEVVGCFAVGGFSFSGNSPNSAVAFTTLKPIKERTGKGQSAGDIVRKLNAELMAMPEALVVAFEPPAIMGIGNVGGFQFELLDQGGHTLDQLAEEAQSFIAEASKSNVLKGMYTSFTADNPQLEVDVDRDKAKMLGIPLSNIFDTIHILLGSQYVNDFDFLDRVYRVYVQADKQFRAHPDVLNEFYVKSETTGDLIPLSGFLNIEKKYTPQVISHFDLFRSVEINGSPAQGYSSGQAIVEMQNIANKSLPEGMSYKWAGISLEQLSVGQESFIMFALGLLFVYLVLAAQYESLIDPMIIILAVPLAIFGALLAQFIRGLENDVFCQIGLVMLVGLACKNSILIVEFANQLIREGHDPVSAVLEAGKTRFRPIMMTSLAFIFGIFPLVVATGAGASSRNSMGTAVFGGMFFSTILSLFVVPVLFLVAKGFYSKIQSIFHKK